MKKKIFGIAALFGMLLGSVNVGAAETPAVVLTAQDEITYENCIDNRFGDTFEGMAPGDERTQTIRIVNENSHAAAFFLSQETVEALEEANEAAGGAYTLKISVGESEDTAESLLDIMAGGYTDADSASTEGLAEITELQDYTYLVQLASGKSTNLYLTLSLNGEGMDSTTNADYTNAAAKLQFQFRAYYKEEGTPTVITEIKEEKVPLFSFVKTGDATNLMLFAGILLAGVVVLVVASKRRKAGNTYEK